MPDRRGPKGSVEDFLPEDRIAWAKEIWADRHEVAKLSSGPWMLREAAKVLGISQREVDKLLRP